MQEKYEQLKADTDVQAGSKADDHIFFKACGGWSEKGTVYGLGREGPAIFERPSKSRRSTSGASLTYASPFVAQLQNRLQTTENDLHTTQHRLHTTENERQTTQCRLQSIEAELRATREELEATKKQLDDQRLGLLELNARVESF